MKFDFTYVCVCVYMHIHIYDIEMLETTGLVWETELWWVIVTNCQHFPFAIASSTLVQFAIIVYTNDYNTYFSYCLLVFLAVKPVIYLKFKLENVFCSHLYT